MCVKAASNRFSPLPAVINDTSNLSTNWTAPVAGFLKVNVDGALFSASNSFGLGGLARDANGHLIEAFCLHKPGCVQPSLVEAIGVKEALSWIKTKGWEHVILETDSLVVVQALQSNVVMQSLFGSTITYCRNLLKSLPYVNVCFVKRSANNAAHCLARGACFWLDCIFVGSNVPDAINNAVMADLAILS
uniref:RNase H type-1 domain-containing protein n=1 Tax=Cannabis sativa TaxID=3483 RepID=A0A803QD58_CANSA